MPFFRRKSLPPAPLPGPGSQPQHWVAYMYAPQPQPMSMPPIYALQSTAPYGYHLPAAAPADTKYALHPRNTIPVQYLYPASSSVPHLPPNALPPKQLVHSAVAPTRTRPSFGTDFHQTPRHRASSSIYPGTPVSAPFSRGGEADRHYDEFEVDVQTQPKHSVFSSFMDFVARSRSKSRGRAEPERPRSRGAFTDDDGHDRGRAMDPRYVNARRARRLSGEQQQQLKRAKHESMNSFDEKSARGVPLPPASLHRSSTKEDLKRRYEEEDRLRQQQEEEYQRAQIAQMRPSSRNRPTSPDDFAQSPTLKRHTELNARQFFPPHAHAHAHPDAGYHTDAPPPKSARRSSVPLHLMQSPREKSAAPTLKVPEGFFNRRGDQLMNSKGDVLRRPSHMEYPPEFAAYPPPGTGWRDHKGQLVGPDLRWIRKVG